MYCFSITKKVCISHIHWHILALYLAFCLAQFLAFYLAELSEYYDEDLYELTREYEDYWSDKYPTTYLDTGDKLKGSDSQHADRDPAADSKRRAIDTFLNVPNQQPDPMSYEDKIKVYGIPHGIVVTEVAEPTLIHWIEKDNGLILYLDIDEKEAVGWLKERRKCLTCGNVHHMKENPPKFRGTDDIPGVCDRCGTDLIMRPEDKSSNVRHQFNVWRQDFTNFKNQLKDGDFIKLDLGKKDYGSILEEAIIRLNNRFMK